MPTMAGLKAFTPSHLRATMTPALWAGGICVLSMKIA